MNNFYNITPSVEGRIIEQNDYAFCFPALMPIIPGHTLISPIRPVSKFFDMNDKEIKSIFDLMEIVKIALKEVFDAEGFNHAWNEGGVAGQSVDHFHLHVLPRKKGDTGLTKYEPRDFIYRSENVENRASSPEEEIKEIVKLMKLSINNIRK